MKGNTKKTGMYGFAACWARRAESRQKPLQLPSSRRDGDKWSSSKEEKHWPRLRRKLNRTGGIPRGKAYARAYRLGYRSESRKDFSRATQ